MNNDTLMIKVVKTLRYSFDLTTNENGFVVREDGSVIAHQDNFLDTMKMMHVVNGDAYQMDLAIDWTSAQIHLRVPKFTIREDVIEKIETTPELTTKATVLPGESTAKTHGPDHEFKNILVRGGRTGRKIHLASDGGSGSYCGHWFKAHTSHFKVADDTPENRAKYHRNLCTKCFSETSLATAISTFNNN